MNNNGLTRTERRAAHSLAGIFGLRMLGLFMLYPVFAAYTHKLPGATPLTIGIALGIYGLTQALLQLPAGLVSDRLGRKPVITAGLVLFAVGSVIAALAHGIQGIIIGRAIQGGGAVGAATLALAADLSRPEQRTKVIGIIGMGIGLAFGLAVVAGPVVNAGIGLSGIFWVTAILGVGGIGVVWGLVPTPAVSIRHRQTEAVPAMIGRVLADRPLRRLYASIFLLHLMLIALFLALPLLLRQRAGLATHSEWLFYLPVFAIGFVLMIPAVIYAERRGRIKSVALAAILLLGLSPLALVFSPGTAIALGAILTVFFGAFTLMEALLPSLISRVARPEAKGTAMGVYSTSQFFGIFAGGALGGFLQSRFGIPGLLFFVAAAGLLWFIVFAMFKPPRMLSSRLVPVKVVTADAAGRLAAALESVPGVGEAVIFADEGLASLRVERERLDETALQQVLQAAAQG